MKKERKDKKNEAKAGSKGHQEEVSQLKSNIELGRKCLVVLNSDLEDIQQNINNIEEKVQKKMRFIRNLQRGDRDQAKTKKTLDQMTLGELEAEEQRLEIRISTANLDKKQET